MAGVWEVTTGPTSAIVVEMSGNAANVLVVDQQNLHAWRRGGSVRYKGGFFRQSPAVIRPGRGHWFVIVDPQGGRTDVEISVRG